MGQQTNRPMETNSLKDKKANGKKQFKGQKGQWIIRKRTSSTKDKGKTTNGTKDKDNEQIQQRRNTMDKQKKDKRTNIKQDKEDNGQCT